MTPKQMWFRSRVRPEQQGLAVEVALARRFTYHSEDEWRSRVASGSVLVEGVPAQVGQVVRRDQEIAYCVAEYHEPEVPLDFGVCWENEEFLLIDKPAGCPVHHTGRIFFNTLTAEVRRRLEEPEASPMHRLDRDTSGLLLFARSKDSALRYQKHLPLILPRKIYLAAVPGCFPASPFMCKTPLREAGTDPIPSLMVPDVRGGKVCCTGFSRLAHLPGEAVSLVQAELHSGRKHQIRAHLSHLGYPVVGDALYSHGGYYYLKRVEQPLDAADLAQLGSSYQLLHAWRVLFHPPGERQSFWVESRRVDSQLAAWVATAGAWGNWPLPSTDLP